MRREHRRLSYILPCSIQDVLSISRSRALGCSGWSVLPALSYGTLVFPRSVVFRPLWSYYSSTRHYTRCASLVLRNFRSRLGRESTCLLNVISTSPVRYRQMATKYVRKNIGPFDERMQFFSFIKCVMTCRLHISVCRQVSR